MEKKIPAPEHFLSEIDKETAKWFLADLPDSLFPKDI